MHRNIPALWKELSVEQRGRLASRCDASVKTISQYFTGRRNPSPERATLMAEVLHEISQERRLLDQVTRAWFRPDLW